MDVNSYTEQNSVHVNSVMDNHQTAIAFLVDEIINRRDKTFRGFSEIERKKGFILPDTSFSSSQGQEMLRIMLFRVLEEIAECAESEDVTHQQEEAIDAINYMISALMIDSGVFSKEKMKTITTMFLSNLSPEFHRKSEIRKVTLGELGNLVYKLADVGDTLRSRAWMRQTQSLYFVGESILTDYYYQVFEFCLRRFSSIREFIIMYLSKDDVLQFRLKTKY